MSFPEPTPRPALAHTRLRSGPEEKALRFLVGDWTMTAQVAPEAGLPPVASRGSVSVRYDLGGLLLTERWSFQATPDSLDVRLIWCRDRDSGEFRVFRFDSAGTSGDEYRGKAGDREVIIERRFEAGGARRVERRTYQRVETGEIALRRVAVTVAVGDEGEALQPLITATLERSER